MPPIEDELEGQENQTPLEQEEQVVVQEQQPAPPEIDYDRLAEAMVARLPQHQQPVQQQQVAVDPYESLAELRYDDPTAYGKALVDMAVQEVVGRLGPVINPLAQSHVEGRLMDGLSAEAQEYVRGLGPIQPGLNQEAINVIRDAAQFHAIQKTGQLNAKPPVEAETGVGRVDNFRVDTKTGKALSALEQLSISLTGKGLDKAKLLAEANKN